MSTEPDKTGNRRIEEFVSLRKLCAEVIESPLTTIRIYASQGKLPGVVKFGSRVFVHLPTFREYLLKNGRPFIEKKSRKSV